MNMVIQRNGGLWNSELIILGLASPGGDGGGWLGWQARQAGQRLEGLGAGRLGRDGIATLVRFKLPSGS